MQVSISQYPLNSSLKTEAEEMYVMQKRKFHLVSFNGTNVFPVHAFTLNFWATGVHSSFNCSISSCVFESIRACILSVTESDNPQNHKTRHAEHPPNYNSHNQQLTV